MVFEIIFLNRGPNLRLKNHLYSIYCTKHRDFIDIATYVYWKPHSAHRNVTIHVANIAIYHVLSYKLFTIVFLHLCIHIMAGAYAAAGVAMAAPVLTHLKLVTLLTVLQSVNA